MDSEHHWYGLVRYAIPSIVLVTLSMLHFWLPSVWTVARPLSALVPVVVFATVMVRCR